MEGFLFLLAVSFNLGLVAAVVRNRGLLSIEGMALSLAGITVALNTSGLVVSRIFDVEPIGGEEKLYPALLQTIGFLALWAGLWLSDPRPSPIRRDLCHRTSPANLGLHAGYALVLLACVMAAVLVASEGIWSLGDYVRNMDRLQIEPRKLGIFLDRWSSLLFAGGGLLLGCASWRAPLKCTVLAALCLIAFLCTASKASVIFLAFPIALTISSVNQRMWRRLAKPLPMLLAGIIGFAAIGVKTQIRFTTHSLEGIDYSRDTIVDTAFGVIGRRFGPGGLADGYYAAVSRLSTGAADFTHGDLLRYMFVGSVPRFLWPGKPDNPLRGVGHLFDPQGRSDARTAYAPTLIGWAYCDFGVVSLVGYLFCGGLLLGAFRRRCTSKQAGHASFLWYLMLWTLTPFGIAETGFDSLLNAVLVASVSTLWITLWLRIRASRNSAVSAARIPEIPPVPRSVMRIAAAR